MCCSHVSNLIYQSQDKADRTSKTLSNISTNSFIPRLESNPPDSLFWFEVE